MSRKYGSGGGRKPGGGRSSMSNSNSNSEEEGPAAGGGEAFRIPGPAREPYDPSQVWREHTNELERRQRETDIREQRAFEQAQQQAYARQQGYSAFGVSGHYGPGSGAAAAEPARPKKGPGGGKKGPGGGKKGPGGSKKGPGGGKKPTLFTGVAGLPSNSSSSSSSNNSNVTIGPNETLEYAQERAKAKKKQTGTMYNAPWSKFPKEGAFQNNAARAYGMTPKHKEEAEKRYTAKYAHPKGNESWHMEKEANWGMGQVKIHRKAVSKLNETIKSPNLALLAALTSDLIRQTGGVSNNTELGSVSPVKTLALAKSILKSKASKQRLTIDMADDATRLEGFTEFVAQLHTAREGQAWVMAQLQHGKQSKSGKHVIVAAQLENIKSFYKVQEELALANIRSLKETQAPTIGYDRIDRFFRDIALDINRAQNAYEEAVESLASYPGYSEMIDAVVQASADGEDEGVNIPNLIRKLYQLSSLILATNDLHMTARGSHYIKEKMFDVLSHFRLLLLRLEYKGEEDYKSLEYIDFEPSNSILRDVLRASSSYRRTAVYESNILYAGGFVTPIELLKSVGRTLKASTRSMARGIRSIRGRQVGVNDMWDLTRTIMKRACQPLFGALSSLAQDYFEDSPHTDSLSMDMDHDIEPRQIDEVVEDLRGMIVQRWPKKTAIANRVAREVQAEVLQCTDLRRSIDEQAAIEPVNDEQGGEASIANIMRQFEQTVQQKLRNKRAILASARAELRQQDTRFDEALVLGIETPITEAASKAVEDGTQTESVYELPMSKSNLNNNTQVEQESNTEIEELIDEIRTDLNNPSPSAPPKGNLNSNSNVSF